MIEIRRSEDRGRTGNAWLDSRHTFSFAEYCDPDFTQFSVLRVINQDLVQPGEGFGTHSHKNMEIISFVLDGVMEHKDNMGEIMQMRAGDVQIMSAGSGLTHSENNGSSTETLHFLQMWIQPLKQNVEPRYEQKTFSGEERQGKLRLAVSPDGESASLIIGQDAKLYLGLLAAEQQTQHALPSGRAAWLHLSRGWLKLNGLELDAGDGAAIRNESTLTLEGLDKADFILWELPAG